MYERGRRSWVSEKICLREYFSAFAAAIPTVSSSNNADDESNTNIWELMDHPFTDDEIRILSETCRFVYTLNETISLYGNLEYFSVFRLEA